MEENERNTYLDDNDDFGLADSQYDPIDRDDDFPPQFEDSAYYDDEEEESRNQGLIVAIVLGFLVLVGLGVYLFGFGGTEQIAGLFEDKPTQTLAVTDTDPVVESEPAPVVEPAAVVEEPQPTEEVSDTPEIVNESAFYDNIQTISAPTGRSFIVVGSFVDADLAQDYSNKLIAEGVGSRILSPTSRAPLLHRVAIADFDTFPLALERVAEFKSRYGESTWVLKF